MSQELLNINQSQELNGKLHRPGSPFDDPIYLAEQRLFRIIDGYLRISFYSFVAIPIFIVCFYYSFLASNQYTSEVRAVIRAVDLANIGSGSALSSSRGLGSPSLAGGQGGGARISALSNSVSGGQDGLSRSNIIQTAPKEAYLIQDYVRSMSIINDLKPIVDLQSVFQKDADFWARLPEQANEQEFLNYWKSHIQASVEGPAGVLIIRLRTFNAEQSRLILNKVIQASEALVNNLQKEVLAYTLRHAQLEYEKAQSNYRDAQNALMAYRAQNSIVNPYTTLQTTSQLLLVALSERTKVKSDLRFMKETMSDRAPSVKALEEKLKSLNEQIQTIQAELTGPNENQNNLAAFMVHYEALELRRILAEGILVNASGQVENSRLRLNQQKIYVEPFIGPTQMESSDYPTRLMTSLIFSVFILMVWSIHALIILAVRDQLI